MDIHGKVVFITGASAGIGLATAQRFAREGAKLALVARSADILARLTDELRAQGCEAVALPADLRDPAQVKHAVAETVRHYGRIDILINNAGQAASGTVADLNPDDFHQIIALNVFAPLIAMQSAIPVMREQGDGLIINVSSMVSRMRLPGLAAYAATKAALNMLSDTARVELAGENIRVISILPRMTATDFTKNSLGDPELRRRQRTNPAAPVDTAEYVADRILAAAIDEPEEQYMDA
jgi:NAD(P)-dependent dehydrogenase (short-subunit alcohol dehydrogenase family)